jgi:hypothetical protein
MKTSYRYCQECKGLHDVSAWPHAVEVEAKYDPSATYDEYLNGPRSGTFMKCKVCGDMHDVYNWPGNHMPEQYDLRSELGAPYFISDNLESLGGLNGIQCQASGLHFTSKSKLRREYKARNVIEVGNDPARNKPFVKPKPDRKQIKEALHKAMYAVQNEGATTRNFVARRKPSQAGAFGAVQK